MTVIILRKFAICTAVAVLFAALYGSPSIVRTAVAGSNGIRLDAAASYQTIRTVRQPVTSSIPVLLLSANLTRTSVVAPYTGYPNWIPQLSVRARQLYQRSLYAGHDPHMFTVSGDSNSNPTRYLGRITSGTFGIDQYPNLKSVVSYYSKSFTHTSMAVGGGLRAADMFDTANMSGFDGCLAGEGMFACELRLSNASIIFIQLGTGDKFLWRGFELNYRRMIDYATANHVLPVLVTKADDIESLQGGASFGYINDVIRRLALEYQVPLLDMYAATRNLPVIPNPALPHRPYTIYGLQDEWGYYFHLNDIGQNVHVLITLQALDSIRRQS